MRTRVVSDPVEARALWDMLSPLERPFDLWELRECFYRPLGYELHFIVAEDESGPVGLLPLQWNTGHGQHERYYEDDSEFLEFFGGGYPLDNRPYLARPDARISQALFAAIDRPARLQEIIVDDPASVSDNFVAIEPDYSLPLAPYADIYDYLSQTSSSVHAGKARREMRQLEAMGVDVIEDDMSDLDLLFSWSIARFGDESSFTWDVRRQAFRDMLALSAP